MEHNTEYKTEIAAVHMHASYHPNRKMAPYVYRTLKRVWGVKSSTFLLYSVWFCFGRIVYSVPVRFLVVINYSDAHNVIITGIWQHWESVLINEGLHGSVTGRWWSKGTLKSRISMQAHLCTLYPSCWQDVTSATGPFPVTLTLSCRGQWPEIPFYHSSMVTNWRPACPFYLLGPTFGSLVFSFHWEVHWHFGWVHWGLHLYSAVWRNSAAIVQGNLRSCGGNKLYCMSNW